MSTIDLRSDTVTVPTDEMRRAMAAAEVGDDVWGEDPTVNALEERAADLLGKEAGLFVSSGTMGNLVSLMAHVPRGGEIIAGAQSHIVRDEAARHAVVVGIVADLGGAARPAVRPDPLALMITGAGATRSTRRWSWSRTPQLRRRHGAADRRDQLLRGLNGVHMRLDGARLWSPRGVRAGATACRREFDTVSVCLSKGSGHRWVRAGRVRGGGRRGADLAEALRRQDRRVGIWRGRPLRAGASCGASGRRPRAGSRAAAAFARRCRVLDPDLVETNILVMAVSGAGWTGAGLAAAAGPGYGSTPGPSAVRLVAPTSDVTDVAIDVVSGLLRSTYWSQLVKLVRPDSTRI
jgi:threonine aldolase